ncbi:MAG: hypothetical protein ACOYMN_25585 [Roseimicrobium sp.]
MCCISDISPPSSGSVTGGGGGSQWVTGDRRTGYWTDPGAGWVLANGGTIGNADSGADRANADTEGLFVLLFDMWKAFDPTSTLSWLSGASCDTAHDAATNFADDASVKVPDERLRVPVMAYSGMWFAGVAPILGATGGSETHTLTEAELPVVAGHTHTQPAHTHTTYGGSAYVTQVTSDVNVVTSFATSYLTSDTSSAGGDDTGSAGGFGSGAAHNNVQPFICINVAIKL